MSKAEVARGLIDLIVAGFGGRRMIRVSFQRFPHAQGLQLPEYQSEYASGMDLVAPLSPRATTWSSVPEEGADTDGFGDRAAKGLEAQIRPRSGLALKAG